jgi:hypothetical protein
MIVQTVLGKVGSRTGGGLRVPRLPWSGGILIVKGLLKANRKNELKRKVFKIKWFIKFSF